MNFGGDYGNNTSYSADSSADRCATDLAVQLGLGLLSKRWLGVGVVNYNHFSFVRPRLSNHTMNNRRPIFIKNIVLFANREERRGLRL